MRKRTIVVITIILLLLVILLLILFNSYLNNEEDENVVQNVVTNTNNNNITTNVNSSQEDVNTNNEVTSNLENTNEEINYNENNEGGEEMKLNIKIGDKNFTATLEDNATTRELLNKLPLTINMSELHGNEKYYYFDESMPTNSIRVGNINTGDLMLYGSDCLVLFYDSFSTPYSYTRLGHIDNPQGLAEAVGNRNTEVTFEISNN